MAMTKKEQAEMQALRDEIRLAKALRWTGPAPTKDVPPPTGWGELSVGWWYRENEQWGDKVDQGCSSSVTHSTHSTTKTSTQGPRYFYSTKLRALQALRVEVELVSAKRLAAIDAQIEAELAKEQGGA